MYPARLSPRERIGPALLTAAVVALVGWTLLWGLAIARTVAADESLATFDVVPPRAPPPVRVVPKRTRSHRPSGRAAPAGLRSQATAIVAPPVQAIVPPPVTVAPVAGTGRAATQGAAARPGPGPGAGGIGDGRGSGGNGDGDGGPGYETRPRWLRGRLSFRDGARVVGDEVIGRAISARCTLETDTRLTGCVVARSSGLPVLDEAICRLIEQRFRYTPWLDAEGRPVRSTILIDQSWDEER